MRRWLLWPLALVAILAIGLAIALFTIPTERIAAVATERLSAATGRDVRVGGDIRPRLLPNLGVALSDVEIGNPDWAAEGPLLKADAIAVGVAWGPLLQGDISVETLRIEAPEVFLLRDAEGRASWTFGEAEAPAPDATSDTAALPQPSASGGPQLDIAELVISDGSFTYHDAAAGTDIALQAVDLTLQTTGDGAADLAASLGAEGGDLEITAQVADLSGLLSGQVSGLAAGLDWPGGAASFDGRLGLTPAVDGQLTLDARDFAVPAALAGAAAPTLPAGLGRDRIRLSGRVTLAPEGSLHLRETSLGLDDNTVAANLDILQGAERPLLRGTLDLGSFILPDAAGGAADSDAGGSSGSSSGWSEAPIDVAGLFALDTELSLNAARLGSETLAVDALAARLTVQNGRAVLDLSGAQIFDGALSGQFVVNGRGGLSTRIAAQIQNVNLQPAVSAIAGFDRLQGTGSGQVSVLGIGNSQADLMRSLEGSGNLAFGAGAIEGLDIAGMIRNFDAGFQGEGARTVYDSVSATFTMVGGVLSNSDLSLSAPWGGITGDGRVDIGAQRMDYLVTPGVLRDGDGGARLSVPVRIEGPWSDLSYRPDLEALAEQELAEELEAVEERIIEGARDAVSERLGVDIGAGASRDEAVDQIEDELGDRLREEVEEGILDLFR